jgi:hypothetical protein
MLSPFSLAHHIRLGEVMLANPSGDRVQARHHFAMAMKLSDGSSARAMIGLALATRVAEETSAADRRRAGGAGVVAAAGVPLECKWVLITACILLPRTVC